MILYFSGTGNSRMAAEKIQQKTGDEMVSLNERIKKGDSGELCSETPFVFVAPTYAWQMPRVVRDHIRATSFAGSRKAYFILTCGSDVGNAQKYAKALCEEKQMAYMGLAGVVMPENYIVMFSPPQPEKAKRIIEKGMQRMEALCADIQRERPLADAHISLMDRIKSAWVHAAFYPFCVHAKGFFATDACVGCGKCERLCPLNNVHIVDGRPVWKNRCTHCMACIGACPRAAIEYKNKTQGKVRYCDTT